MILCSAAAQASNFAIWLIREDFRVTFTPLLVIEGLAGFLNHILNLLQFLLSFLYGFGNINSRHFTLGVGSSRSNREASRINSSGGSSDS